MPTPPKGPRLGGSPAHERLIMANLAQSLFEHGTITTTEAKAKRLRPFAEKLITSAKRGTLHDRREVMKVIRDKDVVHKLFAEIGPSFETRDGGYTRIVKTAPRQGDNAPMAIISLIEEETAASAASRMARRAAGRRDAAAPAAKAGEAITAAGDAEAAEDTAEAAEDTTSDTADEAVDVVDAEDETAEEADAVEEDADEAGAEADEVAEAAEDDAEKSDEA